jgi:DNA polymerase-1
MINISAGIKIKGLKAKMILQIHDELVFDLPSDELNVLCSLVKDRMENVVKFDVPIKIDIKKGPNWLKMSSLTPKEVGQ